MLQLAQIADRPAVERLARQCHALHVTWRPDIYEMPEELYPEDRFTREIGERSLYVAKVGGETIGYVLLKWRTSSGPGLVPRRIMAVQELCVEETLRGSGFGTQIMADVHALARAFGCTDLQLGVYPQNDAAVEFYQKCGFTIRSIEMQRNV